MIFLFLVTVTSDFWNIWSNDGLPIRLRCIFSAYLYEIHRITPEENANNHEHKRTFMIARGTKNDGPEVQKIIIKRLGVIQ